MCRLAEIEDHMTCERDFERFELNDRNKRHSVVILITNNELCMKLHGFLVLVIKMICSLKMAVRCGCRDATRMTVLVEIFLPEPYSQKPRRTHALSIAPVRDTNTQVSR